MTKDIKPLTEAELKHFAALNATFLRVKAEMDRFIVFLQEQHDAPVDEYLLQNLQVGFERISKLQEKAARRRTRRKPKEAEVVTDEGKESDAVDD